MKKTLIIVGSARSDGHSRLVAEQVAAQWEADLVDLNTLNIHPYTYDKRHADDAMAPLMEKVVQYDRIVLVTPVYWYAMSGILKTFLDRLTDGLRSELGWGRKLAGKELWALSCGSGPEPIEGFFTPFRLTAAYLGMTYGGDLHTWAENGTLPQTVTRDLAAFLSPDLAQA